jgi:hypothetical protein
MDHTTALNLILHNCCVSHGEGQRNTYEFDMCCSVATITATPNGDGTYIIHSVEIV